MNDNQPQPTAPQPEQPTYPVPAPAVQEERQDYRDEREGYEYAGPYWPTFDQRPGR